jgi:hypothetical protein
VIDEHVLRGLVTICGGVYGLLLSEGVIHRNPKDPEKMELWRRKFRGPFRVLCPIVIVFGLAQLLGAFRA